MITLQYCDHVDHYLNIFKYIVHNQDNATVTMVTRKREKMVQTNGEHMNTVKRIIWQKQIFHLTTTPFPPHTVF